MYVGRRGSRFYLSRLPGTGFLHEPQCPSTERQASLLSGLPVYAPGSIHEQPNGALAIHTDMHILERPIDPVTALSIDGVLDLLMEQAALDQITPDGVARTWSIVRERFAAAAAWLQIGDNTLANYLFMPPRYSQESIKDTEQAFLSHLDAHKNMALVLAPLKEIRSTQHNWQIVLKHMPWLRLWLDKKDAQTIESRALCASFSNPPAYALCLLLLQPGYVPGNFKITNLAWTPTNDNFFPCRNEAEADCIRQLLAVGETVVRPLRFDKDPLFPIADFVVTRHERQVPVFVRSPTGFPDLDVAKHELIAFLARHAVPMRLYGTAKDE